MKHFSINSDMALGVPVPNIRKISGRIGQSEGLALELVCTGESMENR